MYEVKILTHFSASHHLREYEGPCENKHGHNWKVEVTYESLTLDKLGIVIDFKVLKKKVKIVLEELDHCDLNELSAFARVNPSSENIAAYIYKKLSHDAELNAKAKIKSVSVWETDNARATYYE
jgi:6-pyruvoyltetrahydropterin/6-carboxytetrahydropterin synthase